MTAAPATRLRLVPTGQEDYDHPRSGIVGQPHASAMADYRRRPPGIDAGGGRAGVRGNHRPASLVYWSVGQPRLSCLHTARRPGIKRPLARHLSILREGIVAIASSGLPQDGAGLNVLHARLETFERASREGDTILNDRGMEHPGGRGNAGRGLDTAGDALVTPACSPTSVPLADLAAVMSARRLPAGGGRPIVKPQPAALYPGNPDRECLGHRAGGGWGLRRK